MSLNSGPNQSKDYTSLNNSLQAGLTLVTANLAAATASSNTPEIIAYTAEQASINYMISLLVPNSVSGSSVEGVQFDETAVYQPQWFPR
jgi:capsule polysaccharide export protein KpsE/RkpR